MKEYRWMFGVLALDAITKYFAVQKLPLGSKKEIVKNRIYFRHIKNTGMAYDLYAEQPQKVKLFSGLVLAYGLGYFFRLKKEKHPASFWAAILLGGALGNFLERIWKGSVTDFLYIQFKKAPIFNVADLGIAVGALGILLTSVAKKDNI